MISFLQLLCGETFELNRDDTEYLNDRFERRTALFVEDL